MTQRVLIVAYHYPPSTAVGAVRPSKLVRYLPAHGWRPVVLTATAGEPHADVHRVRPWPHPLTWYEDPARARMERGGQQAALAETFHASYDAVMRKPQGLKGLILPFLRVPDQVLSWVPPTVARGARLIRRAGIRAIVTTAPPFSAHLVGLALKRLTGVAWVADFRDPWLLSHKFPLHRHTGSDWIERRLIDRVLRSADRIVCVTPAMTEQMQKAAPSLAPGKFITITGGFDPEDFDGLRWSRPGPSPVRFAYLGTFYHGRSPEPFLRAVRALLDDGRLGPSDIRVDFVGNVQMAEGRPVAELIASLRLEGVVSVSGPVRRDEALRRTLESHVLLVLDERHPVQAPYKLYEGLAAGVTILNIGSEGAVADVLARTGRGVAVHHMSPEAIQQGILECVARARRNGPVAAERPWESGELAPYHFQALAGRMADTLHAATKESACTAA